MSAIAREDDRGQAFCFCGFQKEMLHLLFETLFLLLENFSTPSSTPFFPFSSLFDD